MRRDISDHHGDHPKPEPIEGVEVASDRFGRNASRRNVRVVAKNTRIRQQQALKLARKPELIPLPLLLPEQLGIQRIEQQPRFRTRLTVEQGAKLQEERARVIQIVFPRWLNSTWSARLRIRNRPRPIGRASPLGRVGSGTWLGSKPGPSSVTSSRIR